MQTMYNFKDPIFTKEKRYKRLANEHISISKLNSDRVKYRVMETKTRLNIPTKYEIDYFVKSIIGIDETNAPIYGNKHTIEISFPARFPLETFKARATTDLWHPNIKWDGPMKGRICVNNQSFGVGYDLFLLVLRIGEIIQYKNYLAENIPPYPEDSRVAKWVTDYAEPKGIVLSGEKAIDDSNLLEFTQKIVIKSTKKQEPKSKITIKKKSE